MRHRQEYLPYPVCSLPLVCYFSFESAPRTEQKGQGMDFKEDNRIIIIDHMNIKIKKQI